MPTQVIPDTKPHTSHTHTTLDDWDKISNIFPKIQFEDSPNSPHPSQGKCGSVVFSNRGNQENIFISLGNLYYLGRSSTIFHVLRSRVRYTRIFIVRRKIHRFLFFGATFHTRYSQSRKYLILSTITIIDHVDIHM